MGASQGVPIVADHHRFMNNQNRRKAATKPPYHLTMRHSETANQRRFPDPDKPTPNAPVSAAN